MNAVATQPDHESQITNAIGASPPGLLALLADVDAKIKDAPKRFKADKVGSIELNRSEVAQLRSLGRQYASRMAAILGVEKRVDVFSPSRGPSGGGNYVGV